MPGAAGVSEAMKIDRYQISLWAVFLLVPLAYSLPPTIPYPEAISSCNRKISKLRDYLLDSYIPVLESADEGISGFKAETNTLGRWKNTVSSCVDAVLYNSEGYEKEYESSGISKVRSSLSSLHELVTIIESDEKLERAKPIILDMIDDIANYPVNH